MHYYGPSDCCDILLNCRQAIFTNSDSVFLFFVVVFLNDPLQSSPDSFRDKVRRVLHMKSARQTETTNPALTVTGHDIKIP